MCFNIVMDREERRAQEKVPKGNDSERGLYLLPDITSHYFLICS